jgi:hypothetical protein
MIDEAAAQRFFSRVDKESGRMYNGTPCWEWKGAKTSGYGAFGFNGTTITPHLFVWVHVLGREVPPGKELHHNCGSRSCCNPLHLEQLTPKEHKARHHSQTHCRHGHEWTPENTKVRQDGRKICRQCAREAGGRYGKAKRLKATDIRLAQPLRRLVKPDVLRTPETKTLIKFNALKC